MDGILIRALSPEDEHELISLDKTYAAAHKLEPVLSRASLNFYGRTGHSFASLKANSHTGFVLAQSIWNGQRPVVLIARLAVAAEDESSRTALIEAVTKSAYDAAVYDLLVLQPASDSAGASSFKHSDYRETSVQLFERILGSRGQGG